MIRVLTFVMLLLSVTACGVEGDLYRPEDPKPKPERKKEMPHPYPRTAPEEQDIMPDLI